jgi:mRNA interferase HigB
MMRIIAKRTLRAFWKLHPDAKGPLQAWHAEVRAVDWSRLRDVRDQYRTASFLPGNRVVFTIGGNRYRLIAKINHPYRIVYIRFVGTHADYNRIDVERV